MTGPFGALTQAFVQIFNFSGRATRSEFWWVAAAFFLVGLIAAAADAMAIINLIQTYGQEALLTLNPLTFYSTMVILATFIPFTSLSIRRLHDAGFSGFWWIVGFVPVVGSIALLILYCLPSQNRTTVYGTPKTPASDPSGKPVTEDAHKRAMQGYAVLFEKDRTVTPQMEEARKAEISEYYRSRVLKPAASV